MNCQVCNKELGEVHGKTKFCPDCSKDRIKLQRRVYRKKHYQENKEQVKIQNIKYREEHHEQMKEYSREYMRDYQKTDSYKAKRREYEAQRRSMPEVYLPAKCRITINQILEGTIKSDSTCYNHTGLTLNQLREHLELSLPEGLELTVARSMGFTIDHIKSATDAQFDWLNEPLKAKKEFNHYTNLRMITAEENYAKRDTEDRRNRK